MKSAVIFNDSGESIIRRTMGAYKIADMMRIIGWDVEVSDWLAHWSNEEIKEFIDSLPQTPTLFAISNLWMNDEMVLKKIKFLNYNFN